MTINYYINTKRMNSTAAAPTALGSYSCTLKNPTSYLNPVLVLKISGDVGFNYFSIGARYYWVTDIISLNNDLWEIHGSIDALGTFRKHIQATSAFVLYDSTTNTELPDGRLGISTTPTTSSATANMPWGFDGSAGTYFIAIQGDGDLVTGGSADGATGVYITDMASIEKIGMSWDPNDLLTQLNVAMTTPFPFTLPSPYTSVDNWASVIGRILACITNTDIAGTIGWGLLALTVSPVMIWSLVCSFATAFINGSDALKYVKAAYWLPFNLSAAGTQKNKIALGSFIDIIGTSKLVTDPIHNATVTVSIPWQYTDWRNVANTEIQLFIPLIGVINIPASAVKGQNSLSLRFAINMFSGHFAVKVMCGDVVLGCYGTDVSMQILIGDSNISGASVSNTIVSTAAATVGAATGVAPLAVGAAAGIIQNGIGCIQPINTCVGGLGGGVGADLGTTIYCTTICHNTTQSPSALINTIGTPTNQLKTLNGSGYCQTMNAQMDCTSIVGEPDPSQTEVLMVNAALNSGVYLE